MLFDDLDCASSHHVSLLPFNFERKKIVFGPESKNAEIVK